MLMKTPPETLFETEHPEFYRAVQAGSQLLDKIEPGWASKINLSSLSLPNQCNCILGQIYGSYEIGLKKVHIISGCDHGFSSKITKQETIESNNEQYVILQEMWVHEILKRRAVMKNAEVQAFCSF
ncbi:MAG TPA: hypothetical protein VEP90_00570 [Methylomirabilota bacterium]|nr:hypothetical protein [Methylomirabilota bacterium]